MAFQPDTRAPTALAVMKPTHAPNIDPSRKMIANIIQWPRAVVAFVRGPLIVEFVAWPQLGAPPKVGGCAELRGIGGISLLTGSPVCATV